MTGIDIVGVDIFGAGDGVETEGVTVCLGSEIVGRETGTLTGALVEEEDWRVTGVLVLPEDTEGEDEPDFPAEGIGSFTVAGVLKTAGVVPGVGEEIGCVSFTAGCDVLFVAETVGLSIGRAPLEFPLPVLPVLVTGTGFSRRIAGTGDEVTVPPVLTFGSGLRTGFSTRPGFGFGVEIGVRGVGGIFT